MSLVGRLTAFFLGALALVLVGFSIALYLLAHTYLSGQADERLEAALHTLTAAAEVKPDGVEWDARERLVTLGQDPAEDQVRWIVHDDQGQVIDHSPNLKEEGLAGLHPQSEAHPSGWRLKRFHLEPSPNGQARVHQEDDEPKHAALILTAGVSLQPMQATLGTLAAALFGLSLGLWLFAALLGRRLCRRALTPLTTMAAAARAMRATDLDQRLPAPRTRDELEDLGRAFNDLLARLQEAFERQRRFTGDASHQLRTPLTALLGQVEVALHRERPADEYRQTLGLVRRRTIHLSQIVESLLFLARADAEAGLPDLETVDLAVAVENHLQGWSDHSRRADIRMECSGSGTFDVRVHAPLLGQLLDTLLDNACKYSEPGSPILMRLGRDANMMTLAVEDAGCGIAAEDLPHVFEPFYRSSRARLLGRVGVGLGLAVAQRIATAFGGTMGAESGSGQGSRILLRLPEVVANPPLVPEEDNLALCRPGSGPYHKR